MALKEFLKADTARVLAVDARNRKVQKKLTDILDEIEHCASLGKNVCRVAHKRVDTDTRKALEDLGYDVSCGFTQDRHITDVDIRW